MDIKQVKNCPSCSNVIIRDGSFVGIASFIVRCWKCKTDIKIEIKSVMAVIVDN